MAQHINIKNLKIVAINGGELNINELPDRAIALDGAVQGPVLGDDQDRWSFDHHAGCSRLITDATCQQVSKALLLGLDIANRPIYVNDIDGDTLVSLWLLAHPTQANDALVADFVQAVGVIDAHGPAGAQLLTAKQNAMSASFFGRLRHKVPSDVQAEYDSWPSYIERGFESIENVLADASEGRLEGDQEAPEIIRLREGERQGVKAIMARADGFGAFAPLYHEGFRIVCLVSSAADGTWRYTIGKLSDLVRYHLGPHTDPESLLGTLRAREPGWGGGSSIGGSPRLDGGKSSSLTPEQIWDSMDA